MTPPADDHDDAAPRTLEDLLALGVQRIESEGAAGLEALCAQHPEQAGALRTRLAALDRTGLLRPPPRLGRFTLLGALGRGGMGVVHLARDEEQHRLVALKTLPARVLASERSAERFRREVAAVRGLQHPSIVPLVDAGEEGDVPWMALDYVPGRTLAEALDDARSADRGTPTGERWPPGERGDRAWCEAACRVVIDIADGLHHAHRCGVVHRDVKPENILLGEDGRARLLDFGLAQVEGKPTLTTTGEFTGTPSYAAPEQVSGDGTAVDARTDVHALGVTLYELLTLRRPFGDDNAAEVARRIVSHDPVRPSRLVPSLPRDLDAICMTALEKRPARRYPTAAALAADLRAFLDGDPIAARAPSTLTLLARAARRRPAVAVAAVLAIVLAVGGPLQLWRTNRRIEAALLSEEDQRHKAEDAAAAAERSAEAARAALADAQAERARADVAHDAVERSRRTAFLVDSFIRDIVVSPDDGKDDAQANIGDVLDRAESKLVAAFASDADLLVSMRLSLSKSAFLLGRYDQSARLLEQAWTECEPLTGPHAEALRYEIRRDGSVVFLRQERYVRGRGLGARGAATRGALARRPDEGAARRPGAPRAGAQQAGQGPGGQRALRRDPRGAARRPGHPSRGPGPRAHQLRSHPAARPAARDDEPCCRRRRTSRPSWRPADDYQSAKNLLNRTWVRFYDIQPTAEDIAGLRHALDVLKARAGPGASIVASMSVLLGKLLQRVEGSDPVEIEALLRAGAEGLEQNSQQQVTSLMWWAAQLRQMGRLEEALAVLERCEAARAQVQPHDTPVERLAAQRIALLRELGRTAEADALLAEYPDAAERLESATLFDA
jgi:serine/threonine protein kinase